jgi:hypothetical protein
MRRHHVAQSSHRLHAVLRVAPVESSDPHRESQVELERRRAMTSKVIALRMAGGYHRHRVSQPRCRPSVVCVTCLSGDPDASYPQFSGQRHSDRWRRERPPRDGHPRPHLRRPDHLGWLGDLGLFRRPLAQHGWAEQFGSLAKCTALSISASNRKPRVRGQEQRKRSRPATSRQGAQGTPERIRIFLGKHAVDFGMGFAPYGHGRCQ